MGSTVTELGRVPLGLVVNSACQMSSAYNRSMSALRDFSLERMVQAVEAVRSRLMRATAALEAAGVPYAVIGGNAVAAWVARVDRAAVRNTQDVDVLLRRADFAAARTALELAGFVHAAALGVEKFLDGPTAGPLDTVSIVFANEKVREPEALRSPDVESHEWVDAYRIATLDSLVRMKLTSYRLKDRVHLQDLLAVGLIDAAWVDRVPPELRERMAEVIANPDG